MNLSAMLAEVESLIPAASCWTGPSHGFPGFYLGEEDLGSEDGAVGGTAFNYNWTVSAYCLHPQVRAPNATAVECRPSGPLDRAVSGPGPVRVGVGPVLYPWWAGAALAVPTRRPEGPACPMRGRRRGARPRK